MKKILDFSILTDEQLLFAEKESNEKLGKALVDMMYNADLEDMYSEVEAIREEKLRRKNGKA
jgi:hypothetical protein